MARKENLSDNLLTSGQNEGIEKAVLQLPQLLSVTNARMRKGSRWGKRFGHTGIDIANLTGTAPRCIGGAKSSGFCVVDDLAFNYNQNAATFVVPSAPNDVARVAGAVSGWLPETSFFPVPPKSFQRQNVTPCASTYGLGYLWTATQFENPAIIGDQMIRVVATDPRDQTLVFMQEFTAATSLAGGILYPRLITCGSTIILTYRQLGAPAGCIGRRLTSIGGGFGAATTITVALTTNNYDASPYDSVSFLLVVNSATVWRAFLISSTTLAVAAASAVQADSGGLVNIDGVSIVGATGTSIYVGYGAHTGGALATRVAVFSTLATLTGTATLTTANNTRPLLSLLSTSVRAVYDTAKISSPGVVPYGLMSYRDVTSTSALSPVALTQTGAMPASVPFTIGTRVYMWVAIESGGPRYAALVILPAPIAPFVTGYVSCPVQLTVQDFLLSAGLLTELDLNGLPRVTQIGTGASWCATLPTLYSAPGSTVASGHDFRVVQSKHYTDLSPLRGLNAIYADSVSFVPMGLLTRFDDRGAQEEGFLYAPQLDTPLPAAGGSLTPSSDYFYTAVYRSRNSDGRYEVSAPATPVKITMGAADTQNTISVNALSLTAKQNVQIEVYRTLADEQTFYLVAILDNLIPSNTYADQMSDADARVNQTLYVQVGQNLANAPPPSSRFGCVGGQRLFLGGGIRPDVVTASKLIFGDQSPTFTDGDAFRIVTPSACTGIAWMDTLVLFTEDAIYIASGDGPDDSGVGDFGNLTRMPYQIGCIEPRSIVTVDDGTFFQTSRGLYLLPRGFGAPVPAGDAVMDTLATYSYITSATTLTKSTEQAIYWSCSNQDGTQARRIVYDLAHKAWGVDSIADASGILGPTGMGQWVNGEVASFMPLLSQGLRHTAVTGYIDVSLPIAMSLKTGEIRPFGSMQHGAVQKIAALGEVRSACTVNAYVSTDQDPNYVSSPPAAASRIFSGTDPLPGECAYIQVDAGAYQHRDLTAIRVELTESSTSEGFAFISMGVEYNTPEGLRLTVPADRIT